MKNIAILGNSWGDEGKGHITHHFSKDYNWVIRFSGGANAGHTIYRDGVKYVHNLIPSFDWRHKHVKAFLGSGMVIDLEQLCKEVKQLHEISPEISSRVYVDPDAFVVLPEHKEEDKASNGHIGSTNRGIGPAYKSKIARAGFKIRDAIRKCDQHIIDLNYYGVKFTYALELERQFKNDKLLFEGAQGIMLDINHGTYPYVSCGDATIAGIVASGFATSKLDKVYGVAKCYTTKVGEGPFPTELSGPEADELRKLGNEYGATTGRPRKVGWIDLPALRYACKKGGINSLILTKFDILNGKKEVPMCVSYGKEPVCSYDFFDVQKHNLQYINVPGWKNADNLDELKPFISLVEGYTGVSVEYISKGVKSTDIIAW